MTLDIAMAAHQHRAALLAAAHEGGVPSLCWISTGCPPRAGAVQGRAVGRELHVEDVTAPAAYGDSGRTRRQG